MDIGDKVYSYKVFNGIFTYTCIEERKSSDNTLYVFECEQCSHGYKCHVLLAPIRSNIKTYQYVDTLNDNPEDGDDQSHWHSLDGVYYESYTECKKARSREAVRSYNDKIAKAKKDIAEWEKVIKELEVWVASDKPV